MGVDGILLSVLVANLVATPVLCRVNSSLGPESTTVVLSYNGYMDRPLTPPTVISDLMMMPPILLEASLRGNRVEWIRDPTREQVMDKLAGPSKNIVFIGHGCSGCYQATDGLITAGDVVFAGIKPRADRTLSRYTCGGWGGLTFEDVLLTDPSRERVGYDRSMSALALWWRSWQEAGKAAVGK